ncbi:phosphoribosylanthranilate isomerase [uncultured bacterium]|nr:phosphoribosylanthranilate isomerase [uncultured bacterium]
MRTRVKICGFTRVEDAVFAAYQGVDAIGLVFYPPSPRNVSIEQAQKIVAALPAFTTVVGLFVNETPSKICEVLNAVRLDCLQFHGDETPNDCWLFNFPYIKAIRMQQNTDIVQVAKDYDDAVGLLLDAYHADARGGTGQVFDWELIPECDKPIILAGGLDETNVKQAIHTVRPYALDLSSGVESAKGIKDARKIAALIQQVNEGDREKHDRKI